MTIFGAVLVIVGILSVLAYLGQLIAVKLKEYSIRLDVLFEELEEGKHTKLVPFVTEMTEIEIYSKWLLRLHNILVYISFGVAVVGLIIIGDLIYTTYIISK